jgi:predicted PurR-regulated permease PerM
LTSHPGQKSLILWGIWMTALAGLILWCAFLVRDVLLLIYISGLLAIGFSPIVRLIERQKVLPIGTRRFPRWLAILILYLVILATLVGIGFMIFPPLAEQAVALWDARTTMFDRAQDFLIEKGLLREHLTLSEAVERTPVAERGTQASAP